MAKTNEESAPRKRATAEDKERARNRDRLAERLRVAREIVWGVSRDGDLPEACDEPLRTVERALMVEEKKLVEGDGK